MAVCTMLSSPPVPTSPSIGQTLHDDSAGTTPVLHIAPLHSKYRIKPWRCVMFRRGRWTEWVTGGMFARPGGPDATGRAHGRNRRSRWVEWHDRHHSEDAESLHSWWVEWHDRHHRERGARREQGGMSEPPTV